MTTPLSLTSLTAGTPAGVIPPRFNSLTLDSRHLEMSKVWHQLFEQQGVFKAVETLLGRLFSDVAEEGPSGTPGSVITTDSFSTRVLVPLLVTMTGLVLTTEQTGLLRSLLRLVSVTHLPDLAPLTGGMKSPRFLLKFKTFKQVLAQRGQMITKVGSSSSHYTNVEITLEKRTAGFSFGDAELALDNNLDDVIRIIAEKMQCLDTTWALTMTYMHSVYAAAQPSVSQLTLAQNQIHQPADNLAKLMQYVFMEHIMCAALNRSSGNMRIILSGFAEFLQASEKNFCCVYPQTINEGVSPALVSTSVKARTERVIYNTTSPIAGYEHYNYFGGVRRETGPLEDMPVHTVPLNNGGQAIMLAMDGDGTADTVSAPLIRRGVKRLFMTVGACPDAYKAMANPSFFDNPELPRKVLESCPGTTYFMDFDYSKIAKVNLIDCHQALACASLFDTESALELWKSVFPTEAVTHVNEDMTAALLRESRAVRASSPLMIFETNPRFMWLQSNYPQVVGGQQAPVTDTATNTSFYYFPRAVLGNASPCSDFANEIVGSVGQLSSIVHGFTAHLAEMVNFVAVQLQFVDEVTVATIRDLRSSNHNAAPQNGIAMATLMNRILNIKGVLSDPYVQVLLLTLYDRSLFPGHLTAAQDDFGTFLTLNKAVLEKFVPTLRGAVSEVAQLVSTVYGEHPDYNLLLAADNSLVAPTAAANVPLVYDMYLKFMYGFVMPALSTSVNVVDAGIQLYPDLLEGMAESVSDHGMGLGALPSVAVFLPVRTMIRLNLTNPYRAPSSVAPPAGGTAQIHYLNVVRPLFKTRIDMLMEQFAGCHMVRVLGLMHYWTRYTETTMKKHLDRVYYSGISYMLVRHMSFRGHTLTGLPIQGARLLIGNKAAAFPNPAWQSTDYKQTLESAMVPMDMTTIGVTAPHVFVDELRGVGSHLDPKRDPNHVIVVDCYNDWLPEAMNNHQPGKGFLSVHGRFDDREDWLRPDMDGNYIGGLPTACLVASHPLQLLREQMAGAVTDGSSLAYMAEALEVPSFAESIPAHVIAAVRGGLGAKEVINQIVDSPDRNASIFEARFGGMVTDDFVVGRGASVLLRSDPMTVTQLDKELTPRIFSIGGLSANSAFGATDEDPPFATAFIKQFSLAKMAQVRTF